MSDIAAYLDDKRRALAAREGQTRRGAVAPVPLTVRASVEGRSGVRRHAVATDSLPDVAGSDLGPGSPELRLVVLGSCLAHTILIQARVEAARPILNLPCLPHCVTGRFVHGDAPLSSSKEIFP